MQSLEVGTNHRVSTSKQRPSLSRLAFGLALLALPLWFVIFLAAKNEEKVVMAEGEEDNKSAMVEEEGSQSSVQVDDSTLNCIHVLQCHTDHTDRLGHNQPILKGHAICNHEYQLGLTDDGSFILQRCSGGGDGSNEVEPQAVILHQDPSATRFEMSETAVFQLYDDDGAVRWDLSSNRQIFPTKECLHRPQLDCPYLHLRKSGDIVLNWIDGGTWMDRKVQRCFPELKEKLDGIL